jgi:glutaredoxin
MPVTEILYFSSPTCVPCKALKPTVDAFGATVGIPVRVVDCLDESNAPLVAHEQIRMVPTIVVRHENVTISKMVGPGQWAPDKIRGMLSGLAQS